MKTCLYSLSQLDGVDPSGSSRFDRQLKFVNHYWKLRDLMGFDSIIFSDNGSSADGMVEFLNVTGADASENGNKLLSGDAQIKIFKFNERLEPRSEFPPNDPRHGLDYPYCWRGLDFVDALLSHYDKVVFIDSDCFVLSPRFAKYIKSVSKGWETVWCPKHSFPDASFQIITQCENFELFTTMPWSKNNGRLMEWALPFTNVRMDFVADRFGESREDPTDEMDFYGQCPVDIEMRFRHEQD